MVDLRHIGRSLRITLLFGTGMAPAHAAEPLTLIPAETFARPDGDFGAGSGRQQPVSAGRSAACAIASARRT